MANKFFNIIKNRFVLFGKRVRNRLPDGLFEFSQKRVVPYLSIIIILAFTLVADLAQAKEDTKIAFLGQNADLSPAEVANVVSVIGPVTANIDEDPLTVAIAMQDNDFLQKPEITETKITQEKAPDKRSRTLTYTVEDGDTLAKIAWKYSLKISTIKSINGLNKDTIRPGQQLKIPPQDVSPSQIAAMGQRKVAGVAIPFAGTFRRPTSGWAVSQVFGHTSFERWHTGIDLDSRSGRTIFASASGRVSLSRGWGGGYGNHIVIDHGQGFSTLYGHLASFSVSNGQWVNQGQPIGIMGTTGWSTGIHLHFEIRVHGSPQNPTNYL